jgi:5-methylcytosine-specific restriction protein B
LFPNPHERSHRHATNVECGWLVVPDGDGRLLQLETYGSAERQIPGKTSQSIQLDRQHALELLTIIRETFPGIA